MATIDELAKAAREYRDAKLAHTKARWADDRDHTKANWQARLDAFDAIEPARVALICAALDLEDA